MSRLTKKSRIGDDNKYYITGLLNYEQIESALDNLTEKLGQLEDIEEKIVCPLEVVWKATNNGFYTIDGKHFTNYMDEETRMCCIILFRFIKYDNEIIAIVGKNEIGAPDTWYEYRTRDYKKTWWLKEDKSE